jgi:hypothetical protein
MGIRETGWGLGFYRAGLGFERGMDGGYPWHPRLGHAARIRVCQHGGGGGHGGPARAPCAPTPCVTGVGRERREEKRDGERADCGVHLAVTQGSGRW